MNLILRILLAVILGVIATALLDHYGVLTTQINFLIGIAVALIIYFGDPIKRGL